MPFDNDWLVGNRINKDWRILAPYADHPNYPYDIVHWQD
jgi:hypothetical protein